jgi:hypothetical protein
LSFGLSFVFFEAEALKNTSRGVKLKGAKRFEVFKNFKNFKIFLKFRQKGGLKP